MEFIAEIGQAHEGSLGMALSYIDALANTGVNVVKFQVHIAAAESSLNEPFRVNFSFQDKSRYDYWKRMEFTEDQWKLIKKRCEERNLEFLASPFSNEAVDLLERIGVRRYKVGSGEVNNFLLLEKIMKTGKPIILSSGMSSFKELDESIKLLKNSDSTYSILQCTTSYPTEPQNYGFNVLKELKDRYGVKIGFSDHSGKMETCVAATAFGAEILEFHAVFSRHSFGPDTSSSLEIREIEEMVKMVQNIKLAMNSPVKKNNIKKFSELKNIFEKSLAINKDLPKGHILRFEDLESKKPSGFGINTREFKKVIGKEVLRDCKKWEFLTQDIINHR